MSSYFINKFNFKFKAKCRKIVGAFKHSDNLCRKLKEAQIHLHHPAVKFCHDVPTRWLSTFYMLDSILVNKESIREMQLREPDLCFVKNILEDSEYKTINDYCTLLQALVDAIVYLSGRKYVTSSSLIPIFFTLINYKVKDLDISCMHIKSLQVDLVSNLRARMNYIFQSDSYLISTILSI